MDAHDKIDNFCLNNEGDSIKQFESDFRAMCTKESITKEEFKKWKEDFRMFLYENPSFGYDGGIGWERQFLLDLKF